jgi:ribonuclease HI
MQRAMKRVTIYTDGACSGNPGPGGWAAILVYGQHELELTGGEDETTNNRMELQAAIEALRKLREPCEIDLFTDSKYVLDGLTKWLPGWKRKGWRTADGSPVKNRELWEDLDEETRRHKINWNWVRGHNGHPMNERVDVLAVKARDRHG